MTYTGISILIVEDNPGDARLILEMLSATEYASAHFHSVGSLREAQELAIDHASVAMVLLDLNLPDSTGMDTLVSINTLYPDSAVIVLTGLDDVELAIHALREGAQNYLTKDELNASRLGRTLRFSIERHGFIQRLREADKAVIEREHRFRKLIEHSSDGICLCDASMKTLYVSPAVLPLLGYSPEDLTGQRGTKMMSPKNRQLLEAVFERVSGPAGTAERLQLQLRHKNGGRRWVDALLTNMLDISSVRAVVINFRDITADRAAQVRIDEGIARVIASEEEKSSTLNALPANIALLDPKGTIIGVNQPWRAFADANGYTGAGHGVGSNYVTVSGGSVGMEAAEGIKAAAGVQQVLEGNLLEFDMEYPCEGSGVTRWYRMLVAPRSEGGRGGAVVMHLDITVRKMAEEELRSSRSMMAEAQRVGRIGSWFLDMAPEAHGNTVPVFWSEELFRILGYEPGAFTPLLEHFTQAVHPEDRAQVQEIVQRILATSLPIPFEHRIIRPDGTVRWLHQVNSIVASPRGSGHVQQLVGTAQDITDRKLAAQELAANVSRLAEAQRLGQIGSWEHRLEGQLDPRRVIGQWSDEMYRVLGHAPGSIEASFANFLGTVHPEDLALVQGTVLEAIHTGKPCSFDHRIRRPDGQVRWLHEETLIHTEPSTGRPQTILGTLQDITERKNAEDRLRASEERFRAMIEGSEEGISLVVPGTGIVYSSPSSERILGRTPEEVMGQALGIHVAEAHRSKFAQLMERLLTAPGGTERTQFQVRHKNGDLRWLDASFTNMLHIPAVQAVVTNYRDVTGAVALHDQVSSERRNLSAMINSTQDLVWSVDRDFCLITGNDAFLNIMEQAAGIRLKPGDNLMIPDVDGASPTDHWRVLYNRAFAGESFTLEEHMSNPAEAYNAISYNPIRDGAAVVGVAVFSRNITQERLAQQDLERSNHEMHASQVQKASILDALPARVVLLDQYGTIMAVNQSWRTFWEETDAKGMDHGIGMDYLTLARQTIGDQVYRNERVSEGILSVLQGFSSKYKMECGIPPEAPTRWFQLRAAPIFGQNGAVVMHTDVTDLRLAREEVQRWNTLLEDRVVERTTELILVNEELEAQTEKSRRLSKEVASRTNELMSSINYASGIQRSLIPERQKFEFFTDMGLVFRPRDVVSGDFLWCHGTEERVIVTVGDCTGHGVPGAMLSMLGIDLLNNIVSQNNQFQPKEILAQLDQGVNRLFLRAEGLNISDGMDMAVLQVDKATLRLTFAGAGLPMMILRNGDTILLPGTKNPIGGSQEASSCKLFHEHTYQLCAGDRVCLFTDGYADQFGGPDHKKLFRRKFFELLSGLHSMPATEATEALDRHFTEWKGTHDQVDDVLVLLLDV